MRLCSEAQIGDGHVNALAPNGSDSRSKFHRKFLLARYFVLLVMEPKWYTSFVFSPERVSLPPRHNDYAGLLFLERALPSS